MKQRVFDGMEYVYAVYREGSFQKAAEKLFVSQPSVSASVRRVEERVGSRLFDRSRKPLALTECGEAYIACTEKIFAMERDFTEYVNDWEGLRRGRLAVGGSSLFSSLLLPPMMASFRERYPGITLTLAEETTRPSGRTRSFSPCRARRRSTRVSRRTALHRSRSALRRGALRRAYRWSF